MQSLTKPQLLASFINVSKSERAAIVPPRELALIDWPNLEFLGWRDPKAPLRGYLVIGRDADAVGVALRAPETRMTGHKSAACMLCRTGRTGADIALFTARRSGSAGRNGDTIGTYICADFACSANVRVARASATLIPDPGLTVEQRIANLIGRVTGFLDEVARG
jgi:treble-clef zinc-finger protein